MTYLTMENSMAHPTYPGGIMKRILEIAGWSVSDDSDRATKMDRTMGPSTPCRSVCAHKRVVMNDP